MYYKGHHKRLKKILKSIRDNKRNNIANRSLTEIENEIEEFNLLNIKGAKIETLKEKLSSLIVGHSRTPYSMNPGGVFRARKNGKYSEFNLVSDVSYPDWIAKPKEQHSKGRCHDFGENTFYCATERDTAIVEVNPEMNDIITLIDFTVVNPPLKADIHPIGVCHLQKLENGYKETFKSHYLQKSETQDTYAKNLRIDEFLNEKFHKVILSDEEWKYNTTIAITKILMTGRFVGILYPSISAKMKGANFIFRPEFADKNFRIIIGRMYKVVETTGVSFTLMATKILDRIEGYDYDYRNSKIYWRDIIASDQELVLKIEY